MEATKGPQRAGRFVPPSRQSNWAKQGSIILPFFILRFLNEVGNPPLRPSYHLSPSLVLSHVRLSRTLCHVRLCSTRLNTLSSLPLSLSLSLLPPSLPFSFALYTASIWAQLGTAWACTKLCYQAAILTPDTSMANLVANISKAFFSVQTRLKNWVFFACVSVQIFEILHMHSQNYNLSDTILNNSFCMYTPTSI